MNDKPKCELCGEPMPEGEEMFKYHGYSSSCPKPPLPRSATPRTDAIKFPSEVLLPAHEKHLGYSVREAVKILGDHARQLERELAATCEERDRYKKDSERWRNTAFFIRKRIEWLSKRGDMKMTSNVTDREQLVREAEELAKWFDAGGPLEPEMVGDFFPYHAALIRLLLSLLPKEGEVVSDEMLNFLHGIGPLNGVYFGEKPEGERGQYWWRKQLPNARPK